MHEPLDALAVCLVNHVASSVDVCRKNVFFGIQRKSSCTVHDDICPFNRLGDGGLIADVAGDNANPIFAVGVIKLCKIQRRR